MDFEDHGAALGLAAVAGSNKEIYAAMELPLHAPLNSTALHQRLHLEHVRLAHSASQVHPRLPPVLPANSASTAPPTPIALIPGGGNILLSKAQKKSPGRDSPDGCCFDEYCTRVSGTTMADAGCRRSFPAAAQATGRSWPGAHPLKADASHATRTV